MSVKGRECVRSFVLRAIVENKTRLDGTFRAASASNSTYASKIDLCICICLYVFIYMFMNKYINMCIYIYI